MDQKFIRDVCWEIGSQYPFPPATEHITLSMIEPGRGYIQWHIREESVQRLQAEQGDAFHGSNLVIRVYDVTDVEFNGFNAHSFFDIEVHSLHANYYLNLAHLERYYMAEIGFRLQNNSFHALARSNLRFFDRARSSGNMQVGGLFVGKGFKNVFPVENVFDAPVYEKLQRQLLEVDREEALSVGMVFLAGKLEAEAAGRLETLILKLGEQYTHFGGRVRYFSPDVSSAEMFEGEDFLEKLNALGEKIFKKISSQHGKSPFHLLHCHDWYSAGPVIKAAGILKIPMILTLHSTEYERAQGSVKSPTSAVICEREKAAIKAADLIIVPHSSTRHQVITVYGAAEDRVVIIPDVFEEQQNHQPDPGETKKSLHLNPMAPLALFAGEISHAAGADILIEALMQICGRHPDSQFALVGEGPLKGELEGRVNHAGIGHRCRFTGDVSHEYFESILLASDFAIIPARTWQDEGFAQMALAFGKPVLTTHQAHINCVQHGRNGVVTYDNPGSIVWGINEMLSNPLQGSMLRIAARRTASETQTVSGIAAEHYAVYENLLKTVEGGNHV